MSGFESPNYTQIPNDLFALMPEMGQAELRVVLVMCRETFGYHREKHRMSIRKLARATGLTARNAYLGAEAAVHRGLLTKEVDGGVTLWGVIVRDTGVCLLGIQGVSVGDTPSNKETLKKKDHAARVSENPPAVEKKSSTREIQEAYEKSCGYPVDWRNGNSTAAKWLSEHGYSAAQVISLYGDMKHREFWRERPLHLQSIVKEIGEWTKSHSPGGGRKVVVK